MALVNLEYGKLFMQVTDDSQDGMIQIYLDHASADVVNYCNRDLVQTTYPAAPEFGSGDSGIYGGTGSRILTVRQTPITTLSSIYLDLAAHGGDNPDGAFAASTLLTYGTDYFVDWDSCLPGTSTKCSKSGRIFRVGSTWPRSVAYVAGNITGAIIESPGIIKVAYTAGYPTVPHPIRNAVCMLAALIRRNAAAGGNLQSESLGEYSYSLASPTAQQLPEMGAIRDILAKYVRRSI